MNEIDETSGTGLDKATENTNESRWLRRLAGYCWRFRNDVVIPLAGALNGVRVFLTGYLVQFAGADAGEGFMHFTEGGGGFVLASNWTSARSPHQPR